MDPKTTGGAPATAPPPAPPRVTVVVIAHDDAAHVATAVRSALAQGASVAEVVAVDDASTDGTGPLLDALAADEPRLTVVHRTANSGGCGTPRNDGLDRTTTPYVMFLDSDDVLPPGATDALLTAARLHGTDLVSGLCVRRELPSGQETPWLARLYARPALIPEPAHRPALVRDTLCVNKLYRTGFLRDHGVRFPEGRCLYEDFVFTARVLAARPRTALIPDTVYVWQVRRTAERLSLSLDRSGIGNWQARLDAHRTAVGLLLDAGEKQLARAARTHFVDHSLRMYARELGLRDAAYRTAWWQATRAHLETFDAADLDAAPSPGRVVGRVVLASPTPRDLPRLREIAARPARLLPPYPADPDGTPLWAADLPGVPLDHLLERPAHLLPVTVEGELRPGVRGTRLRLRLHDLYGRLAEAGPRTVDVTLLDRHRGVPAQRHTVPLTAGGPGAPWTAEARLDLPALTRTGTWDIRLRLHFTDATHRDTTPHAATGPGLLRRTALPSRRHGLLLVQPYATHSGSLALRTAPGLRGLLAVTRRRASRLLRR
ncbi:glycosyltransferase [Streptomyces sp. SID5785]|uniref:glycosyltransferase n=1 Tax=Streptomyces sp. SID5785 TaxID=2690309 RepID=UPI001360B83A|nr:glycosyltransferase [Streptomyces sp. SID5785]